jgi:hypothetical protein
VLWIIFSVLVSSLILSSIVGAWSTSVHHDHAIIISNALRETPSIPAEVRENVCTDTIYATSLAGDDWDKVVDPSRPGGFPTYQYNTAENAFEYFRRIRDNWGRGDFDNAIALIGVVLHETGDAVDIIHNQTIREYYREYIEPFGSDDLLWDVHRSHWGKQQAEAYTDTDSAWSPRKPENYGSTDDGSLEWFLDNYFYDPAINNDTPDENYGTFLGQLILRTSVENDWSPNDWEDNIWFYWVNTRDPAVPKWASDQTLRLVYNGVYRALRDGEYWRQNPAEWGNPPPANWPYWPWPTGEQWLSLPEDFYGERLYEEGMDTVRWYEGIGAYGGTEGEHPQPVSPAPVSVLHALLFVFVVLISAALVSWKTHRKSGSGWGHGLV